MSSRLLPPEKIPDSLWNPSPELILMPESLSHTYRRLLEERGLVKSALQVNEDDKTPIGGPSLQDTDTFFARRFQASSGRSQLCLLDPKDCLRNASDVFVQVFSQGKVALLDIPCGSGATTAALLCAVAELRARKVLPRLPLEVRITGGDVSPHAGTLASQLFEVLSPYLESQDIRIDFSPAEWDVFDGMSTTALIKRWLDISQGYREYFVLISNFSGVLSSSSNWHKAESRLEAIFCWAKQQNSQVVWIEPNTREASDKLFSRLVRKWLQGFLPKHFKLAGPEEQIHAICQTRMRHVLDHERSFRVQVALLRLEQNRTE